MSTLLNISAVSYKCQCQKWVALCWLYFCRHCQALRCRNCVSHEVDCHYCPNCLENMPSAEARLRKNKCINCYDCPSCGHALSTRATTAIEAPVSSPSAIEEPISKEKESSPRKVYYLVCGFCRWSSREAGIPDQNVASGNWPEYENQYSKLLSTVQDSFHQMAALEKTEKERKKYTKRRSQLSYVSDKYGLQSLLMKKRLGLGLSDKESDSERKILSTTEPADETQALPESIFNEELKLASITTIEQRHRYPEVQAEYSCNLLPVHKSLSVKRAMRCKQCDHNLYKPEFNPSSIKYKLLMTAIYHVPEIRLLKPVHLTKGETCTAQLTLCNMSSIVTHVVLLPNLEIEGPNVVQANVPLCEFVLPIKDDTLDLEDPNEVNRNGYNDDKSVVIFRAGHKIGVKIDVKYDGEENEDAWLYFIIKYDYANLLNMITTEDRKETPEIIWLQQKVRINLNYSPDR